MTLILVIEDEELVRANILELLELESFEAIGAENGREGVELASLHLPDLIISDVMMPSLDGYGVLKALRATPETAIIPFIFLTAKADRWDWRQGMELGADDYLTKPCTSDELLRAIATRLERQRAAVARYTRAIEHTESQLHRLIYYDRLTNLPNRRSLRDWFDRISDQGEQIAVMVLGLDRFNRINHSLGHAWGDELLKAVVQRLRKCLGSQDLLVRLEAEKLAIVRVGARLAQAEMAQALLLCVNRPFTLEDREISVTASIGIGCGFGGEDVEKVLQGALRAIGKAQQQGGNQYQFYSPDMDGDSSETLALETDLRYAIAREELAVHYQPKVNLKDGSIVGAEALLRWQHPERGRVSPAKFIGIAEETGMIVPIGQWVLQRACQDVKYWQGLGFPDLRVAVNLSARQLMEPTLPENLVAVLEETGLDPKYLELELTERIIVSNATMVQKTLKSWQKLGIKIAMDDFGTGYSGFNYLQVLPFDILKIDRSFFQNITGPDDRNISLVKTIIQMAHKLQMQVIAEGVERSAELDLLWKYDCDEIQGYLFSPPLPAPAFQEMILSGKRLPSNDII
ncbi:MAG: putative bifunctional diguanylate cyclase/phosphodiesterase [Hormoscilla sp.]